MRWDVLRDIALVGTQKRRSSLPPTSGGRTNESLFLDQLTKAYFSRKAGKTLPKYGSNLDLPDINETCQYIDLHLYQAFGSILLCQDPERTLLFHHWVRLAERANMIAQPDILVDIIKLGNRANRNKKQRIKKVLGKRGELLLQSTTRYKYNVDMVDEVWTLGKSKDRQDYLHRTVQVDPQLALSQIKSSWQTEGIRTKKWILQTLGTKPSPVYKDFLLSLYQEDYAYREAEKKTETECRYLVSRMLIHLGDNPAHGLACNHLAAMLSTQSRGLLGRLKSAPKYKIDFTKAQSISLSDINEAFGLSATNLDPAIHATDHHHYVSFLVENLPTASWCEIMEMNLDQWVDYILYDDQFVIKLAGEDTSIYRSQIVGKTLVYKDSGLVYKLLSMSKSDLSLLTSLDMQQYESFVVANNMFRSIEAISHAPGTEEIETWSKGFSLKALEAAFDTLMSGGHFPTRPYVSSLAIHLSPDVLDQLEEYHHRASNSSKFLTWEKHLYLPLRDSLTSKKHILDHHILTKRKEN